VGYDVRFLSREFAHAAAGVLAANGLQVWLSDDVCPTPAVSKAVVRHRLAGALILTASHNPAVYHGLKIKAAFGGPASLEFTQAVERALDREPVRAAPPDSGVWKSQVTMVDLKGPYLRELKHYIKMAWVERAAGRVVADPMHGAGSGYLAELLRGRGYRLKELHGDRRADFGGLHPEPIAAHLRPLREAVLQYRARVGLATDGDADRVGVVDGKGRVVDSQHLMALLLWHLVEHRGWKGSVVKTNAVTQCLDRMAEHYGLTVRLTPIGFKYIANWMTQEPVVIGGEESGGMSFFHYMPERDGLAAALLVLEMMGRTGLPLHALVKAMEKKFGAFAYHRQDLRVTESAKATLMDRLAKLEPAELGGLKVKAKTTLDGTKFILENGSWVLFRFSGTEPLLRCYVEAPSPKGVARLLREGLQLIQEVTI